MDTIKDLTPIKCSRCGKKLGEAKLIDGIISIKCKCGVLNTIEKNNLRASRKPIDNQ